MLACFTHSFIARTWRALRTHNTECEHLPHFHICVITIHTWVFRKNDLLLSIQLGKWISAAIFTSRLCALTKQTQSLAGNTDECRRKKDFGFAEFPSRIYYSHWKIPAAWKTASRSELGKHRPHEKWKWLLRGSNFRTLRAYESLIVLHLWRHSLDKYPFLHTAPAASNETQAGGLTTNIYVNSKQVVLRE